MENNEKRVVSKAVVSILLGVFFLLLVLTLIIPGSNGENFFSLLKSETATRIYRIIILALYGISFIVIMASIVKYIKNNELMFYGCFCFNCIVALVTIILGFFYSLFTTLQFIILGGSIGINIIGFIYFVYLAKKDYACLFGVTLDENGVVIPQVEETPIEEVENENEEVNENEVVEEESSEDNIQEESKEEENKDIDEEEVKENAEEEKENEPEEEKKEEKSDEVKDAKAEPIKEESKEIIEEKKVENKKESKKDKKKTKKEAKKEAKKAVKVEEKKEDKKKGKDKKSKKGKTMLFAKKTPVVSQELTKEDLINDEDAKKEFTKEVKNDISKVAEDNGAAMGIVRSSDCKKYFVSLIISILALVGSFFAPIFIGTNSSLYPYDGFRGIKNKYTLGLTIVYAIVLVVVLFAFGWVAIRRKEREEFENRVFTLTRLIFGFSIIYFIFGLVYFIINTFVSGNKGTTYSFIFPIVMMVILVFNAIIKSKYEKDILFVDTNSNIDYSSASSDQDYIKEVKSMKRPYPSAELLIYNIIFSALPVGILFLELFRVTGVGVDKTIKAIDYIKNFTSFTDTSSLLIAFILMVEGVILAIFALLYLITYFGRQKKFYAISTANIILSTVILGLISLYGLYYKIVQATNLDTIKLLLAQFGIPEETIASLDQFTVDTKSYFMFIGAVALLLVVLIRNPMKKSAIYDELDDKKLLEARLNATPINNETLGEYIDNKLDAIPNGEEGNEGENNEENPDSALLEGGEGVALENQGEPTPEEEKVEILEDFDACPAFTELDSKVELYNQDLEKRNKSKFENLDLIKLSHFIINYAANSRLHLSYKYEDIAAFIAGLGCARLTILQGMSGTGKTSLPKIFMEAIFGNCEIIEIESSWREKNELLGFYNEFSKMYTPKKFTQCLYKATLNQDVVTFIVLDEMNLSRIEYYFSDFLSLMENEEDKREIKLSNVKLYNIYDNERHPYVSLKEDHTLKVPANVWFIGTANRDESTFEISDKVYDRAHTMNFNKRAPAIEKYGAEMKPKFMDYASFRNILEDAKKSYKFDIEKNEVIKKVEQLLIPFNISFGNRIYRQIIDFVKVYCSCYPDPKKVEFDAVETILLTKVVMKLENKNIENKELLVHEFEKLKLKRCAEFISKLSED